MWDIKQTEEFCDWFNKADDALQDDTVEHIELLRQFGPSLKEFRFNSGNKVVRIFFIFSPNRNAVLLIGGDKSGSGDKKFYEKMIHQSEKIYERYLKDRK